MVDGAGVGLVVVKNLHGGDSAAVIVTASYEESYGESVPYGQKGWCVHSVVAGTNFVRGEIMQRHTYRIFLPLNQNSTNQQR